MLFSIKNKFVPVVAGIAVLLFFLLAGRFATGDVWVVFVGAVPQKFSAKGALDMESSYMLRQTHEPVFRRDDGQNFESRVLRKWSRSPDFKSYAFCQDDALVFYGDQRFSGEYFQAYISSVTRRYSADFTQEYRNGCSRVTFSKPARGYLDFLAKYENAPSVQMTTAAEAGLGPFVVAEMTKREVRLERKERRGDGYNHIVLRLYSPGDDISGAEPVSDFNKVLFDKKWDTRNYFAFDNVEPLSVVLLINHPDRAVREAVYNCLDIDGFNRTYAPSLESVGHSYISTVLPMGMVGAESGRPSQNCRAVRRKLSGQVLVLANFQTDNSDAVLREYLKSFNSRTGLSVQAHRYTSKELIDLIKEKRKRQPYQLIVFKVDSANNEYAEIFDYFYGDTNIIADIPAREKKRFLELLHEEDPQKKEKLARALAAFLRDEYFALPLAQYSKTMYYPKNIKNITVGRGFIEYPEVADFKR